MKIEIIRYRLEGALFNGEITTRFDGDPEDSVYDREGNCICEAIPVWRCEFEVPDEAYFEADNSGITRLCTPGDPYGLAAGQIVRAWEAVP